MGERTHADELTDLMEIIVRASLQTSLESLKIGQGKRRRTGRDDGDNGRIHPGTKDHRGTCGGIGTYGGSCSDGSTTGGGRGGSTDTATLSRFQGLDSSLVAGSSLSQVSLTTKSKRQVPDLQEPGRHRLYWPASS